MTDPFEDIVDGLDITVDETQIVDVSKLGIEELISLKTDLEMELYENKQALSPRSQRFRDIHSLRNAIQVELAKRMGDNA